MKKLFISIVVIALSIPLVASAQTSSFVSMQNQTALTINSQISLVIQSLLEQVRSLQKQLNDIQSKQITTTNTTMTKISDSIFPPALDSKYSLEILPVINDVGSFFLKFNSLDKNQKTLPGDLKIINNISGRLIFNSISDAKTISPNPFTYTIILNGKDTNNVLPNADQVENYSFSVIYDGKKYTQSIAKYFDVGSNTCEVVNNNASTYFKREVKEDVILYGFRKTAEEDGCFNYLRYQWMKTFPLNKPEQTKKTDTNIQNTQPHIQPFNCGGSHSCPSSAA